MGLCATRCAAIGLCSGALLVAGGCGGGIDSARGTSSDAAVDVVQALEAEAAAPSGSPAQGSEAGAKGTIVLFRGEDANTVTTQVALGDTWLWDGDVWTQWTPAAGAAVPPARSNHGMSTLGGSVVLFGGDDGKGYPLSDTWTWDGSAWAAQ
jgi:hypothetical protein